MSKFDFVSAYAILAGIKGDPANIDEIKDVIISKSGNVGKIIFLNGHKPTYLFFSKEGKCTQLA